MDPIAEIKRLYYEAKPATVARHLAKAIELLKALPSEEERERVAVYMDGLSQMRLEWATGADDGDLPRRDAKPAQRPAGPGPRPAPKRA